MSEKGVCTQGLLAAGAGPREKGLIQRWVVPCSILLRTANVDVVFYLLLPAIPSPLFNIAPLLPLFSFSPRSPLASFSQQLPSMVLLYSKVLHSRLQLLRLSVSPSYCIEPELTCYRGLSVLCSRSLCLNVLCPLLVENNGLSSSDALPINTFDLVAMGDDMELNITKEGWSITNPKKHDALPAPELLQSPIDDVVFKDYSSLTLDAVSLEILGGNGLRDSSCSFNLDDEQTVPAWHGQRGLHHSTVFGADNIGNIGNIGNIRNMEMLEFNLTG